MSDAPVSSASEFPSSQAAATPSAAPEQAAPNAQAPSQSQVSAQAASLSQTPPPEQASTKAPNLDANAQKVEGQEGQDGKETKAAGLSGGVLDAYTQSPVSYEFKGADGNAISDGNTQIVAGLAQDLGLSQEQAQKLYDSGMGEDGVIAKINRQAIEHYNQTWAQEIQADPELGGGNLSMTQHNVGKAMAMADNELKDFLRNSGLGNFPPLVRYLNKVGQKLNSDMNFIGNRAAPAQQEKDWAALLYDHSPNLR